MPHLHLSLQAGDDLILKRMKRRHLRADAVRLVERLKAKRPDIAIGADIIAGFPTEEEDMFANSLALLEDCDIVFGHIFPYSPRPGTAAARMPQLDRATIKARADRLRTAAQGRKAHWLESMIGTERRVLIERDGRTGHAEMVKVDFDPNLVSYQRLLEEFWTMHDPTSLNAQGGDIGTQYRSSIYTTSAEQMQTALASRDTYQSALDAAGLDQIVTEIVLTADTKYYLAEEYHQRYLEKNPNGYDCHSTTGIAFPKLAAK